MKKVLIIALSSLALVACKSTDGNSSSTQASTSTSTQSSSAALIGPALNAALSLYNQSSNESTLADKVQNELSLTSEQAVGGIGALLSVAQNKLSSDNKSELGQLIPGVSALDSTGLTSLITNMDGVQSAFKSLGLDPSLISLITPLVTQYLSSQNASSGLVNSLSALWK
ncbi:putative lipoprotein [Aliivibrio wodanis]|uniref:Putative lipoprotein n=1 Tax=Aliivibrio wodanis TaxID=80852 RepID=A0A090IPH4_9GAMM|nr:putative lipoprotein [Aliivibrio wodanis]